MILMILFDRVSKIIRSGIKIKLFIGKEKNELFIKDRKN